MYRNDKRITNKSYLTLIVLLYILLIFITGTYSKNSIDSWGISKKQVLKKYLSNGEKHVEFSPTLNPEYKNRIMNYIMAIDDDLKDKIKIVRIKTYPQKDFLLIKNKLYSIKETYHSFSDKKLKDVISRLTTEFGESSPQKDANMTTYFFSTNKTKVIVYYYNDSNKCNIYYYDSKLFNKLSSTS